MYGICTYDWLIFMVNVGKYTIHGSYGRIVWCHIQVVAFHCSIDPVYHSTSLFSHCSNIQSMTSRILVLRRTTPRWSCFHMFPQQDKSIQICIIYKSHLSDANTNVTTVYPQQWRIARIAEWFSKKTMKLLIRHLGMKKKMLGVLDIWRVITLPETNMAPKNGGFQWMLHSLFCFNLSSPLHSFEQQQSPHVGHPAISTPSILSFGCRAPEA